MVKIPSLYVYSTIGYSGKSAICLGLALKFKEEGYKVGYFKPIGWEMTRNQKGERIDEDTQLMKETLDIDLPLDIISPIVLSSRFLEETSKIDPKIVKKKIFQAYKKASRNIDLMILESPHILGMGASAGVDTIDLAKKFKAPLY